MLSFHYYIYYQLLNCNYILISKIFYIQWYNYKYQLDPSFLKGVKFYRFLLSYFQSCQIIIDHDFCGLFITNTWYVSNISLYYGSKSYKIDFLAILTYFYFFFQIDNFKKMFSIHYYTYYLLLNCNCILISRIFYIQWYKYQLDPSFLKGVKFYHFYCHIFKAAKLSLIMILRGYCCLPWVRNKIFRIPLSKKKKINK